MVAFDQLKESTVSFSKSWSFYLILFISICVTADSFAIVEHWTKGFRNKREFDSPEAFEKIYVTREQIVCLVSGIYLKHPNGELEKVRSLSEDYEGMFVLRVKTQCPLCGRCYSGKCCPEGMNCPLYDKEILPNWWVAP